MDDLNAGNDDRLLKPAEVAEKLSISRAQAYRLMRTGAMAIVRIGHSVRVKPADLARYVERCRREENVV